MTGLSDSGSGLSITGGGATTAAAIAAALNGTVTGLLWAGGGASNLFSDTGGNPTSTQIDHMIRTNATNTNAATFQSLSNTGFSAIRFADLNGNEHGAIGYGNPGTGAPFTTAVFIETSSESGNVPALNFASTVIGVTPTNLRWQITGGDNGAPGGGAHGGDLFPGVTNVYSIGAAAGPLVQNIFVSQTYTAMQGAVISLPGTGTGLSMGYDATSAFLYAGAYPTAGGSRRQFAFDITNLYVRDGGNANVGKIQVGGSSSGVSTAPMFKSSSAVMALRLADDSADAVLTTGNYVSPAGTVQFTSVATGAADVISAASVPPLTAYTLGAFYLVKSIAQNATTTPTLNINSLGAKTIVKRAATALAAADILSGQVCLYVYDGTNMQLLNPVVN